MELALGTVYPNQQTCHIVPVQNGYAVVQPTYVWPNARHIKLPIPVEDEITTLADSLLQHIQWPRWRILIPPRSRDPNSAAPSAGNTASDAATLALRQQKQHQQNQQLSQQPDSQILPHQQQLSQTLTQLLNQLTQQHSQHLHQQKPQQQPPMGQHQTRKMDVGASWTMANPKYKPGEAMLSEEALKLAGESYEGLHAYVMEQSANGAIDIPAKVAASYFDTEAELKWTVGFNDLYDLFNLKSLDVSLLRCWTL